MPSWSSGLNQFLESVKPLGLKDYVWSSDLALPEIVFVGGVAEVTDLSDVVRDRGPLRGKNGEAFVLYIKDHGRSISKVLEGDLSKSRRVHLTYCETLAHMESIGRYERYHLRNDPDGPFLISGTDYDTGEEREGNAKLWVCQNCLKQLNYQGFDRISWAEKTEIIRRFDYDKYFSVYSSFFKKIPIRKDTDPAFYSSDWQSISQKIRSDANFHCDECGVDCSQYSRLLHVHHRNGVKSDNSRSNLQPLCITCHKRQPHHASMYASAADEDLLTKIRREQGLDQSTSSNAYGEIENLVKLIDPALEEPFRRLSASYGVRNAVVAYEHFDGSELKFFASFAFPNRKIGVSVEITELEKATASQSGWRLLSFDDVMG